MNDYCCTYGTDWSYFIYTLYSLCLSLIPVIIILSGIGFIIGSINYDIARVHLFMPGIFAGIILILVGIAWGITR